MKINKILLAVFVASTLLYSCNKSHYDVGKVHGVNAEGEMLLPLVSGNYSLRHMMERFQIDTIINCDASGNLYYNYCYENMGAVKGEDLLCFKDLNYEEYFSIENPFSGIMTRPIDTVFKMSQTVIFEADNIRVMWALMKSGHFEFSLESNISNLEQVIITSSNIKDANGNDLKFVYQPQMGHTGFDLAGMQYKTTEPNNLELEYEFHIVLTQLVVPEIELDVNVSATELAISEMKGFVNTYETRNRTDTTFSLFSNNVSGSLDLKDARFTLHERNTFGLAGRLVVDTAMVSGVGIAPYDLFSPLPLTVDLPVSTAFSQVSTQIVNGRINGNLSNALISSAFTVNTEEMFDLVKVSDTCNIDLLVDVTIPFSFVSEVRYQDTVDIVLSEIEDLDLLEKLTLELSFTSTIPLNLEGNFKLYNSNNECVTVVLLENATLIPASYDGRPSSVAVEIEIDDNDLKDAMQSNQIILSFDLDTNAHNVTLNADQSLQFFAKAKVKYGGTVEY